jgi:SpoVK/Ycf46/Vps4 family AAA+-type ATPase
LKTFWKKEEHYRKFQFLWKRGVLLWGPPGSGKTSTVQIIANMIVERGGLAIYAYDPGMTIQGLDLLRYIEPKRPIVVILEDIDSIVEKHGEAELLSLLDGEFQVDNAVFIATTNYPKELDQRIINRPSRFDIVKQIDMPSEEARELFLTIKNPRLLENKEELDKWVGDTENFSIAHLKELIVAIECLELPYEEVLKRLTSMINNELEEDAPTFGFIGSKGK